MFDLDPVRIEDKSAQGIPDVNCMIADIELKFCKPPEKDEKIFGLKMLRPGQRAFLFRRWRVGGSAWCLVGFTTEEYILFNGLQAALIIGKTPWGIVKPTLKSMSGLKDDLRSSLFDRHAEIVRRVDRVNSLL